MRNPLIVRYMGRESAISDFAKVRESMACR